MTVPFMIPWQMRGAGYPGTGVRLADRIAERRFSRKGNAAAAGAL
jgi:hypothetical protein